VIQSTVVLLAMVGSEVPRVTSKPRGFTVLSVSPEKWADGRRRISFPSTFPESGVGWNSHPNTSLVSVRVGRSTTTTTTTTTRECPSHHVEDAGFQRHHISISCLSQREIKIFHPYPSFGFADCPNIRETWFRNCSDGLHSRVGVTSTSTSVSISVSKPRGTRPAPPVETNQG
jgi:hypothetical protein